LPYLSLEEAECLLAVGEETTTCDSGIQNDCVDLTSGQNGDHIASTDSEETPLLSKPRPLGERGTDVKISSEFLLTYTIVPFVLSISWFAIAIYQVAALKSSPWSDPTVSILLGFVHLTSFIIFVATPFRPTPPYGLILLYVSLFLGVVVILGNDIYAWNVRGRTLDGIGVVAWSANLTALGLLIGVGVTRPISIPSPSVDFSQIVSTKLVW
jgi:hypothetical protein